MQETSVDNISAEQAEPQGYAALGDRVKGILEAAEQAAEEIREEARKLAADLERDARAEAERLKLELTADARGLRDEAEGFARDMRLSVEAYAKQHRRQAEEEARTVVAEAEKESTSMREAAEQMVRQVEGEVQRRQEELRGEVRMLEHRKREALERLREIATAVQDVLPAEDSIARPPAAGPALTGREQARAGFDVLHVAQGRRGRRASCLRDGARAGVVGRQREVERAEAVGHLSQVARACEHVRRRVAALQPQLTRGRGHQLQQAGRPRSRMGVRVHARSLVVGSHQQ